MGPINLTHPLTPLVLGKRMGPLWVMLGPGEQGGRQSESGRGGNPAFHRVGAGDKEARALSAAERGEDRRGWPRLTAAATFLLHILNSPVRSSLPIPILSPTATTGSPSPQQPWLPHPSPWPLPPPPPQSPRSAPSPSLALLAYCIRTWVNHTTIDHQHTSGGFRTISIVVWVNLGMGFAHICLFTLVPALCFVMPLSLTYLQFAGACFTSRSCRR